MTNYLKLLILAVLTVIGAWNLPYNPPTETEEPQEWVVIVETTAEQTEAETTTPQTPPSVEELTVVDRFTDDDKDLLVKVAFLEAGNQGWEGMAAVMNVLVNRSNLYNASIREIVYSPNQFTGILDLIPTCNPTEAAYTALYAVMNGWDISQGALYFCSPAHNSWHASHLTYLFTFNGHEFYK